VENLAAPFEPEKFRNEYQQKLLDLIEAKREGKQVRAAPAPRLAPVVDLMEALQRSLAASGRKPPESAAELPAKRALKRRGAA
jgi:DNA end-binding protein Ku